MNRLLLLALLPAAADVRTLRVPGGGIQPQVAVDHQGAIHTIYFTGDPANGDVYYVRSRDGGSSFSRGILRFAVGKPIVRPSPSLSRPCR